MLYTTTYSTVWQKTLDTFRRISFIYATENNYINGNIFLVYKQLEVLDEVVALVDAIVDGALPAVGPGHLLAVPEDPNLTQPSNSMYTVGWVNSIVYGAPRHLLAVPVDTNLTQPSNGIL